MSIKQFKILLILLIAVILVAEYDTKSCYKHSIDSLSDFRETKVYKEMSEDDKFFVEATYGESIEAFELRPYEFAKTLASTIRDNSITAITFEYRPEFPESKSIALITEEPKNVKVDFSYIVAPRGIKNMFNIKEDNNPILFFNKRAEVIGYIPDGVTSEDILEVYNNLGGI